VESHHIVQVFDVAGLALLVLGLVVVAALAWR
jgi:hypothetical protein